MSIKLGSIVEITLDSSSAGVSPLKALIHDVAGSRLILSQTSPPIPPTYANRNVHISYISKEGGSARRFGFSAMVTGFADDYRLSSGICVPTLIVEMKREPKLISLRKDFRVRPFLDSGISLVISDREHVILDISLSGVRFVQNFPLPSIKPADRLECRLNIDGQSFPVEAKVIRVSQISSLRHVAAAFLEVCEELQPVLSRKILLLERENLSRRL